MLTGTSISGPFTDVQVNDEIAKGIDMAKTHVWGPQLKQWVTVSEWQAKKPELDKQVEDRSKAHAWYCTVNNGDQLGPLVLIELIDYLRSLSSLQKVFVWRHGMPQWLSVFDCEELLMPLGLNRRQMLRAPLLGRAAITKPNDDPRGFVCTTASISVGGIGINETNKILSIGEQVNLKITSLQLPDSLRTKGRVLYISKSGFCGISFIGLEEWQKQIIEGYIERFNFLRRVSKAA